MRLHVTCMFLFVNIFMATVAREPYCPPVPSCEERLLERVIRNELAMKTLQEELGTKLDNAIKTAMTNITNAVSEITQNASMTGLQLKKDNEILKGSLRTTVDNAIKSAMTNISNAVSEMTQNAKTTGLQLTKQNEILKDQLTIPSIYFHAHSPADYSLENGQVVIYTSVRVNAGQCYNPGSGKFTVSVPGLYVFTAHYSISSSKYAVLSIVHQGTQIQALYSYSKGSDVQIATMQVFIRAAMSDQIWVQDISGDSNLHSGSTYNSFTGALIHI